MEMINCIDFNDKISIIY